MARGLAISLAQARGFPPSRIARLLLLKFAQAAGNVPSARTERDSGFYELLICAGAARSQRDGVPFTLRAYPVLAT